MTPRDRGTALVTVMAATSILFVLATTLIFMIGYQTQSTLVRTERLRAMHVADAGINAYLFNLSKAGGYYMVNPDSGWVTVGDGERYRVVVTAPTGSTPLTLRSTGASADGTVTIAATVKFPTFADYMFLSDSDLNIGAAAVIDGQVYCNADIDNRGRVTGKVMAAGTVTNSGTMDQGYQEHQPVVQFSQVTSAVADIVLSAKGNSVWYPASAASGWVAEVNGANVTVFRLTGGKTTGNLTKTLVGTVAIPDAGAFYFTDDVLVSGNYSKPITIASGGNIWIIGNYKPTDPTSIVTSGLIANASVLVPYWYASVPQETIITAALIAKTGVVSADFQSGRTKNRLVMTGATAYSDSNGGFAMGSPVTAGYLSRLYTYDQRLDDFPPPKYPVIQNGSLKVDTWIEDGIASN